MQICSHHVVFVIGATMFAAGAPPARAAGEPFELVGPAVLAVLVTPDAHVDRGLARAAARVLEKQGVKVIDESEVYVALTGDYGGPRPDAVLPETIREDAARGAAACTAQGDLFPNQKEALEHECRKTLAKALWRLHAERLHAGTIVEVWIGKAKPARDVLDVAEKIVTLGATSLVDVGVGIVGTDRSRWVQMPKVRRTKAAMRDALKALLAGNGSRWQEWTATAPALPEPPPEMLKGAELVQALHAVVADTPLSVVPPQRSWCRGPLPAHIIVGPEGPVSDALADLYVRTVAKVVATIEMQPRTGRPDEVRADPKGAGPDRHCTWSADLKPPIGIRGETLWLNLQCDGGDDHVMMQPAASSAGLATAWASAAPGVVSGFIQRRCLD